MTGSKALLLAGVCMAWTIAAPAMAQDAPVQSETPGDVAPIDQDAVDSSDIIVTGNITFRNRTEDVNPVLSYDLEYFQRFEPVSVGEMLKRVPGVTFASDVLEYDGVQMRGLPSGFTKILINGKRAPGGEADRSFFVDRIPAELVERIEIVRSPTADQSSEGVAGTLNIITKDSAAFDGGFAKIGALMNSDGVFRPSGAAAYADTLANGSSFWAAVNYQQRRNPKKKTSLRYDGDLFFNNTELQDDTRDGTDISGNAEFQTPIGDGGRFRIRGLVVDTDRDEDETSLTFEMIEDPEDFGELYRPEPDELELDGVEIQQERISQQTYAVTADAEFPIGPGELGLQAAWNGFREDTLIDTIEGDTVADAELDSREFLKTNDDEYEATVYYQYKAGGFRAKFGFDYLDKSRDGSLLEDGADEEDVGSGAVYELSEKRYDPYVRLTLDASAALSIDAGLRYEITRRETRTNAAESFALTSVAEYDEESLNPSLSLRYTLGAGQIRASVARTIRRPDYDLISPIAQEEEPSDDNILIGNPFLRNQKSWGVDIGYEQRFARNGIFGINFFYRDITDLIELESTGETDDDSGLDIVSPVNIGDGETWGVEVDLSAPLTFMGLPDTGIFANYTYLDSSLIDPFTGEERRFDNQPHHLYNAGFIHTVRSFDASFGASISGRSAASESNFDETIDLRYDPDLEAFIEKRFGKNFVLRLSAQNLLDREKKEDFLKYDGDSLEEILENRNNGELDELEIERERSGPLFQVTLRAAF